MNVGRLRSSLTRCEPCYRLQNILLFFKEAEMKKKKRTV